MLDSVLAGLVTPSQKSLSSGSSLTESPSATSASVNTNMYTEMSYSLNAAQKLLMKQKGESLKKKKENGKKIKTEKDISGGKIQTKYTLNAQTSIHQPFY